MSLTSLIISILVGSGAAITGFLSGCEWWQILIFLSVYTILQVSVDILLRVLEQKGIISKKTSNKVKEELTNNVNDILDDGKLNNSNEESKDNKETSEESK